jgi:Family of unknown function (DUF5996)
MEEPLIASPRPETWPALPLDAWSETYATLHMWMQIVGKVRLTQTPWLNHSWHVTLYVTTRGLTTSPIPYGSRTFEIDFDFVDHQLTVQASDGRAIRIALRTAISGRLLRESHGGIEQARPRREDLS